MHLSVSEARARQVCQICKNQIRLENLPEGIPAGLVAFPRHDRVDWLEIVDTPLEFAHRRCLEPDEGD